MVYDTQNYWVLRLRPLSGIQEAREHNVSDAGSLSIHREGGDIYSVVSLRKS
jgi:hypothetical protein